MGVIFVVNGYCICVSVCNVLIKATGQAKAPSGFVPEVKEFEMPVAVVFPCRKNVKGRLFS
jgi:hypothetical protein